MEVFLWGATCNRLVLAINFQYWIKICFQIANPTLALLWFDQKMLSTGSFWICLLAHLKPPVFLLKSKLLWAYILGFLLSKAHS